VPACDRLQKNYPSPATCSSKNSLGGTARHVPAAQRSAQRQERHHNVLETITPTKALRRLLHFRSGRTTVSCPFLSVICSDIFSLLPFNRCPSHGSTTLSWLRKTAQLNVVNPFLSFASVNAFMFQQQMHCHFVPSRRRITQRGRSIIVLCVDVRSLVSQPPSEKA
jgi:hypothetical protein